jgi:hypothetical protein
MRQYLPSQQFKQTKGFPPILLGIKERKKKKEKKKLKRKKKGGN